MSGLRIITLDEARDIINEELDYDLINNPYFLFDEWCIDNNVRIKEVIEQEQDEKAKDEYLRS